jgi:PTS system mannose-specific IIA component
MIGIVVAAHGDLAQALVGTARLVFAGEGRIEAVAITESDDAAAYESKLQAAIARVNDQSGVLVLTDMFGGTPSNVGMTMHQAGKIEVLTGANLPMLIKAMQLAAKNVDLATASSDVKEYGRRSIAVASQVLGVASTTPAEGNRA